MNAQTPATIHASILVAVWNRAIACLNEASAAYHRNLQARGIAPDEAGPYEADEDDEAMSEATDAELLDWVDDLEARVGLATADFRAAVLAYCVARTGVHDDFADDGTSALTRVLREAAADDEAVAQWLAEYPPEGFSGEDAMMAERAEADAIHDKRAQLAEWSARAISAARHGEWCYVAGNLPEMRNAFADVDMYARRIMAALGAWA